MKIKIKEQVGAFVDSDGLLINPAVGEVVDVPKEVAESLKESGAAEGVRGRQKREDGPEETREDG